MMLMMARDGVESLLSKAPHKHTITIERVHHPQRRYALVDSLLLMPYANANVIFDRARGPECHRCRCGAARVAAGVRYWRKVYAEFVKQLPIRGWWCGCLKWQTLYAT